MARVTDSRMSAVTGGVIGTPPRTMKQHAPGASASFPRVFRRSAPSYPFAFASSVARRPFW